MSFPENFFGTTDCQRTIFWKNRSVFQWVPKHYKMTFSTIPGHSLKIFLEPWTVRGLFLGKIKVCFNESQNTQKWLSALSQVIFWKLFRNHGLSADCPRTIFDKCWNVFQHTLGHSKMTFSTIRSHFLRLVQFLWLTDICTLQQTTIYV